MSLPGAEHMSHWMQAYQRTAWRYEMKQHYGADEQSIAEFLAAAGGPPPLDRKRDFHNRIRADAAAGKSRQRLKVVQRPYTDDVRFLLEWGIPGNVAAGEDYRILDVTGLDLDLPDQDFWMFDDEVVIHLNYDPDTGATVGMDLIENPDLAWYHGLRDRLLPLAVPFPEYVGG